ncbi:MAG: trehalose-6-phosphate synthase, partial [Phycisphaerales bacterium JB039]
MSSEESSKLVVVANRLPVRRERGDGRSMWKTSPGGLVSALMPILRRESASERGGAWIGWSGATERLEPFMHEGVFNVPVNLSEQNVHKYYEGMANGTLWPLFHDVVRPPTFDVSWWRAYCEVNATFAQAAASVADEGATVWVHDYHLLLAPRMLRARRPDLKIGFFLHIPF